DSKVSSRVPSEDFELKDIGKSMMVIFGRDFDDMARKYSYSAKIKEYLRHIIQQYMNFPAVGSKRKSGDDGGYRDYFAKGWVYVGVSYSRKLSFKIGYSSNVKNRLFNYRCRNMYKGILAQVPSLSNMEQSPAPALWGVYLLEQILHAVHVEKQNDRDCYCGFNYKQVRHGEVFDFEPVPGIYDEWEAGQIRIKDLKEEMDDWARIIRKAEGVFETAYNIHHV
ncbi:hypothetical protein FBU30_006045, partial [Linnemannia zychae]